jgi:hypothetical protein
MLIVTEGPYGVGSNVLSSDVFLGDEYVDVNGDRFKCIEGSFEHERGIAARRIGDAYHVYNPSPRDIVTITSTITNDEREALYQAYISKYANMKVGSTVECVLEDGIYSGVILEFQGKIGQHAFILGDHGEEWLVPVQNLELTND